jgi:hypothetical protein
MAIAIKILSQDDTSMLKNVDPDVFDDPINMARTKKFLADPRHHLAVASKDNLVVGFVSLRSLRSSRQSASRTTD